MDPNYQNPPVPQPRAPQVRFGEWIGEGWRMFTEQWQAWVLLALGLFGVFAIPMMLFFIYVYGVWLPSATAPSYPGGPYPSEPEVWPIILGQFLLIVVVLPLSVFMLGGMYRAAFKQLRGGRIEFKDLFSAGDRFLPVLGAAVLVGLATMIGGMLCVIPGWIAAGLLYFTFPLIIERRMGAIDAMKLSIEATKSNMLMFTLFALVAQLIANAGVIACYVGLLATIPLYFTIHAVAFRDTFGVEGARSFAQQLPPQDAYYPQPPPPPPQIAQPQPQPPPASYLCPHCHSPLPPTAVFCPRCGTGLRR